VADLPPLEQFGLWVDLVGGGLFILLGLALLFVRPATRATLLTTLFALGFGILFVVWNLIILGALDGAAATVGRILGAAAGWAAAVSLFLLALQVPARIASRGARATAFVVVLLYATSAALALALRAPLPMEDWTLGPGLTAVTAALAAFLLLQASRFHAAAAKGDRRAMGHAGMLSLAMIPYLAVNRGIDAGDLFAIDWANDWRLELFTAVQHALVLFVMAAWAWNLARAPSGRRTAVACLALFLALYVPPLIYMATFGYQFFNPYSIGVLGLARIVGVSILVYAIAKQQAFDIEIRLKRGLSRGTLVGIFVAVFFVVSQLIEVLAGEAFGAVLGAIAAGVLLFAIHPLQRLADRISDRAMPTVRPNDPAYVLRKKRETYRNAYAVAWADGHLTQKDMRLLTEFKEALGLPDKEYAAIEKEWAKSATEA
jgi:hypothetical protein